MTREEKLRNILIDVSLGDTSVDEAVVKITELDRMRPEIKVGDWITWGFLRIAARVEVYDGVGVTLLSEGDKLDRFSTIPHGAVVVDETYNDPVEENRWLVWSNRNRVQS